MNLLFLNVGRRCELVRAFRRALGRRGGGLIVGTDISALVPARDVVDVFCLFPRTDEPDFLSRLVDLYQRYQLELLIPTIDPDLERLAAQRDAIQAACPCLQMLLSPDETIRLCADKRLSRERFRQLGAAVPSALTLEEAADQLPVFVKPPGGSAGQGCSRVESVAVLRERLGRDPALMIERVVEGPEVTVDVLCGLRGGALFALPRRRLQVRGGEVSRGIVERDATLERLACQLAEGVGATGPVTVQFRLPPGARPVAMEMNARMGGGLPLTIAAGADWPGWILDLVGGRQPHVDVAVCDRLAMSRYDSSCLFPPANVWAEKAPDLSVCQALIFDLDDTLYPELDFVIGGYQAVARRVWQDFGVEIGSQLRCRFLRGERGDLFTPVLQQAGLPIHGAYLRQLVHTYREHEPRLTPYADTCLLESCRKAGLRVGLISDGWCKVQERKWQALGLAAWFDAVVFSDSIGGRDTWKPSTAPFKRCLQQLGIAAGRACYIGDNPEKDFLGARRLGMKTLHLKRPDGLHIDCLPPTGGEPDATIYSLAELSELLPVLQPYCNPVTS